MNAQSAGRPGETRGWQAVLQRGIDTAAELSDLVARRLGAAADPRARLLRKRRWALRLGWLFAGAAAFWIGLTALLAAWSTPFWVLISYFAAQALIVWGLTGKTTSSTAP